LGSSIANGRLPSPRFNPSLAIGGFLAE